MDTIFGKQRIRRSRPSRLLVQVALTLALGFSVSHCGGRDDPISGGRAATSKEAVEFGANGSSLLSRLFATLSADNETFSSEIETLLERTGQTSQSEPNWPTVRYLVGEAYLRRGDTQQARAAFREIALWATRHHPDGPYGDTWGGSGVTVAALWRWLQLLPAQPEEVRQVLEAARRIQETRFYSGMVQTGLLPALPSLEEDVARKLAHVAWKTGHPEATALFLDFLSLHSQGELDATDQKIQAEILEKDLASRDRLDLYRARRLLNLVKTTKQKDQAADILKRLWENPDIAQDVRVEAGYEWAYYKRRQRDRAEVLAILTEILDLAPDDPAVEKVLYLRGTVHNRGRNADVDAFRADMLELLCRFPRGRLADNALFQLASEHFFGDELDEALAYFRKLRHLEGPHDYQDSAYYIPALGLLGRNAERDTDQADQLLREYEKRYPKGVFRLRSLFWRGRIAERKNDSSRAQSLFRRVLEEARYDYFGLRARMHLEKGPAAAGKDLPPLDSRTRRELFEEFQKSHFDTRLHGDSPYHHRLRSSLSNGLYRQLLRLDRRLARRLDDIPVSNLDERRLLPQAVLLLALRQDALAAKDSWLEADNWLRLSGFLGHEIQDWPVASQMTVVSSQMPSYRLTELQQDTRYLGTVYPQPTNLKPLGKVLADAAWPIDGSTSLSQSLMYSVIRHESRFYPGAISSQGALGLFQFMPYVFDELDRNWNLLRESGLQSETEYLLDPARNAKLWARWVNREFPLGDRNAIAITLMKHHAGSGNVNSWSEYWAKLSREGDLEYRIETARFNATSNFVRRVLRDTTIVEAARLFEGNPGS